MALAAYLDLRFRDVMPDFAADADGAGRFLTDKMNFDAPQRQAEKAILVVDSEPQQDR